MQSKKCEKCGGEKSGTRGRCNPCRAAWERARRLADLDRHKAAEKIRRDKYRATAKYKTVERAGHVRSTYGLSLEEYEGIVRDQGGLCALCGDRPATHVDHEHKTGHVRGVLCLTCNSGLGQLRDSPDLLRRAATYIENGARAYRILKRVG